MRNGCRCWCRWYLIQGARRWEYERDFADLMTDAAPQWRWVLRFEHLLIDETEQGAESVTRTNSGAVSRLAAPEAEGTPRGCASGSTAATASRSTPPARWSPRLRSGCATTAVTRRPATAWTSAAGLRGPIRR